MYLITVIDCMCGYDLKERSCVLTSICLRRCDVIGSVFFVHLSRQRYGVLMDFSRELTAKKNLHHYFVRCAIKYESNNRTNKIYKEQSITVKIKA